MVVLKRQVTAVQLLSQDDFKTLPALPTRSKGGVNGEDYIVYMTWVIHFC